MTDIQLNRVIATLSDGIQQYHQVLKATEPDSRNFRSFTKSLYQYTLACDLLHEYLDQHPHRVLKNNQANNVLNLILSPELQFNYLAQSELPDTVNSTWQTDLDDYFTAEPLIVEDETGEHVSPELQKDIVKWAPSAKFAGINQKEDNCMLKETDYPWFVVYCNKLAHQQLTNIYKIIDGLYASHKPSKTVAQTHVLSLKNLTKWSQRHRTGFRAQEFIDDLIVLLQQYYGTKFEFTASHALDTGQVELHFSY